LSKRLDPREKKAKVTQAWCQDKLGATRYWFLSSPYSVPIDYGIWGFFESKACVTLHANNNTLKASVTQEWAAMSGDNIRKVCLAFRPRLGAMVGVKVGQYEILVENICIYPP